MKGTIAECRNAQTSFGLPMKSRNSTTRDSGKIHWARSPKHFAELRLPSSAGQIISAFLWETSDDHAGVSRGLANTALVCSNWTCNGLS